LVGPAEIEETLITLGLAKTAADVDAIVSELDRDRNGELDFNEFLELLKDTSMKNNKTNFLNGRNLLYQKPAEKTVLPKLIGVHAGEEFKEYQFVRDLRNNHDKSLDMKEKDPKVLEHRKRVRNELDKKRKQLFAKDDDQSGVTQGSVTNSAQTAEPTLATEQTSRFSQGNERARKVLSKKSKTSQDVTSSLLQVPDE